jgi:group II intron reverse transcriptase/maturase
VNKAKAAELLEGRSRTKENTGEPATESTQSEPSVIPGLERVRQRAKKDKQLRFNALLHHLTVERLLSSFLKLKMEAAAGVDGQTWKQYAANLMERLFDLHGRVHRGAYRAQPSRRIYLEKPDGRKRPLGIAVLEVDIQSFFDTMSHEWTLKFLQHRVADPRIQRLIQKWLKAGVSEDGKWSATTIGTPQGAVISPLLANMYLHYALDLWAQQWRKTAAGAMFIIRYADDAVFAFQYKTDAERFRAAMAERLRKFGLELHPEKTRLIEFGRFAERNRQSRGQGSPEAFDFLGLTHICGRGREGKFQVKRRTVAKRMRARLLAIKLELRKRMHQPVRETGKWLRSVMAGYYRYHAVPGNLPMMARFRHRIKRLWRHALRRRGNSHQPSWQQLTPLFDWWLPSATVHHPYPRHRFAAKHPRWEPYAGNLHVRFCPGGVS